MTKDDNLKVFPPQPHHVPNWNVLVCRIDQRSVLLASKGKVPLSTEVLSDLDVRGHP